MQSFSGSFVAYDTKRAACERIYLELFMEHDASDMDSFVEELEEMLSEKLQMLQKKKSILSWIRGHVIAAVLFFLCRSFQGR